jgi:hypothetical protein
VPVREEIYRAIAQLEGAKEEAITSLLLNSGFFLNLLSFVNFMIT